MAHILLPRQVRSRGIRQPNWPSVDETHPINRGLVGYWPLDGEGSGLVPDYSGAGNQGTPTAVGLRDSHHGGNAFSFNGSSSVVTIPSNAAITGAGTRSFACWINTTTTTGIRGIFSYGAGTSNNFFAIYINVTGAGDFYFSGLGNDFNTAAGLIAVNTWNHVAVTYNGGATSSGAVPLGNLVLYVNGTAPTLTQSGGNHGALNTSSSAIHIGDDISTAGRVFSGGIEGARWYNRALDAVEIQQLYAEPYAGIVDVAANLPPPTGFIPAPPLMGQIWLA